MSSGCGTVARAVASDTRGTGSNPAIINFYVCTTLKANIERTGNALVLTLKKVTMHPEHTELLFLLRKLYWHKKSV